MFSLTDEDIQFIQFATFSLAYNKSELKLLGYTGIIFLEYLDALEILQNYLCISYKNRAKLFLEACREKLKLLIQLLANELERTMLT